MPILVDYRCSDCGTTNESFVVSPAPAQQPCAICGGTGERRFSPVGILSKRGGAAPERSSERPAAREASLCATNPDVPGLCHMGESAGRAWVARYRGDQRGLDAEMSRQQSAAAVSTPTMADAITHTHQH